MNRCKKTIAIILVLILALGMTACSGTESQLGKATMKMQKLKNFRMDLDLDLGMNVTMFGEAMDMDMTMTGTGEFITNPLKGKMDLTMTAMDEPQKLLCYLDRDGNDLNIYTSSDDGKTWSKSTADASRFPESGVDKETLAWMEKIAATFEETGTETVNGSEAVVYSGVISMADFGEKMDLGEILGNVNEPMDVQIDWSAINLSSISDIPLTLCIDKKSGMIVKYTMDMTSMMQDLMPAIIQTVMASSMGGADLGGMDLSMLGFEFNFSKLVVTAVLYDFDSVGEITIPPEALTAKPLIS